MCDADGLPLISAWSCVRWRSTAWAKGFIAAGGSRRSSESRWWSSCSVSRSWSSTAACVESPSGTGTKNCRPYPVPTSSISSGYSSAVCCLLSLFLTHWETTQMIRNSVDLFLRCSWWSLFSTYIKPLTLSCFILSGVCRQTGQRVVLNVSSPPWSLDSCDCETVFVRWICRHGAKPRRLLTDLRAAGSLRMCWRCLRSNNPLLRAQDAELNPECRRVRLWGHNQGVHLIERHKWGRCNWDCYISI